MSQEKTGLILNRVKEITISRNPWVLIFMLIKISYCTAICPLRKAKQHFVNMNRLTHKLWLSTGNNSYWKLKGSGRCLITEKKYTKMVVPLKYFCFKYLHIQGGWRWLYHDSPWTGSRCSVIKCSQSQHLLETKQKQKFLRFPQLCFVKEHISSRSGIGHCVPKSCVSSALKCGTSLRF